MAVQHRHRHQPGADLRAVRRGPARLSQPAVTTETAHQDNPNDPSTASVKRSFTVSHAGRLKVNVSLGGGNDIDLYVLRDANGDGRFTPDEILAAGATSSGTENVELVDPPDGNYQVWVHGFAVSGTRIFPLTIDAVQGNDLTVSGVPSGPVAAGTPVTLHVAFSKAMTAGQDYKGELQLGPPSAPTLLTVPIVVPASDAVAR